MKPCLEKNQCTRTKTFFHNVVYNGDIIMIDEVEVPENMSDDNERIEEKSDEPVKKKRKLYERRGKYKNHIISKQCVKIFINGANKGKRCEFTYYYSRCDSSRNIKCSNRENKKSTPTETKTKICAKCNDTPVKRFLKNDPICRRCHNKHQIHTRVTKIVCAKV